MQCDRRRCHGRWRDCMQRDGRISDRRLSDRRRCDANAGDAITGDAIVGGVIRGSERGNHQQEDERWRTALLRESHPGKHRRRPRWTNPPIFQEAATAEAVAAAWDVAARDKNKHHGGRRGGKALLAEFLPNLRRRLSDCLTDQLDRATQSPQPSTRPNCPWLF
jgi:hypothetical protein